MVGAEDGSSNVGHPWESQSVEIGASYECGRRETHFHQPPPSRNKGVEGARGAAVREDCEGEDGERGRRLQLRVQRRVQSSELPERGPGVGARGGRAEEEAGESSRGEEEEEEGAEQGGGSQVQDEEEGPQRGDRGRGEGAEAGEHRAPPPPLRPSQGVGPPQEPHTGRLQDQEARLDAPPLRSSPSHPLLYN